MNYKRKNIVPVIIGNSLCLLGFALLFTQFLPGTIIMVIGFLIIPK